MTNKKESLRKYWLNLSEHERHARGRISVDKRKEIALAKKQEHQYLTCELYEQYGFTKMNIRRLVKEQVLLHVRKGCYQLIKPVNLHTILQELESLSKQRRIESLRHTIATTEYGDRLRKHWGDIAKRHMQNKEFVRKIFNIKKQNGTTNTSKPEQSIKTMLLDKFVEVHSQYISKEYPYHCDFYIKDIDTYIEINFHWTHGFKPYNAKDSYCIEKLKQWKTLALASDYYKTAIKVWTISDVDKRAIALKNNLKYLVFYNWDDFIRWYESIAELEVLKC